MVEHWIREINKEKYRSALHQMALKGLNGAFEIHSKEDLLLHAN